MSTDSWRIFLICRTEKCNHPEHEKSAKAKWKTFLATETIFAAAKLVHAERCSMLWQASHGGTYVDAHRRHCGEGSVRHVVCIANKPWFIDLWSDTHSSAGEQMTLGVAA